MARYDIIYDPYLDPRLGILKNKIGAKTQAALDKAEAEITYVIIATLTQGSNVEKLQFSSSLLCEVHKEIFRDIYHWAGTIRRHDISKESAFFAHAEFIPKEMERLTNELANDKILPTGSQEQVIDRLVYYYDEYNVIHPFREGNGRALRTFLRLLALKYGYDIDWSQMGPEENIKACEAAMHGNTKPLKLMFSNIVSPI